MPSYLPGNLDVAFTGTSVDKRSDGIHFESDPNRCFRLADGGLGGGGGDGNDGGGGVRAVPARERERYGVNELLQEGEGGGGGGRASGKGGTAAVVAHDDETYDGKNATDDMDQDFEDVDDLPPGLDTDLPTALRQFAWAYVRGLGGLVMGVLDVSVVLF